MSNDNRERIAADVLRAEAERRLLVQQSAQTATLSDAEVRALVHELQIRQIELEIQNEELIRVHADAEEASRKYTKLFEFAPIGYYVWDEQATIQGLNLAGAALLCLDRSAAINKQFSQFVSADDRPRFNELRQKALTTDVKQTCEVRMLQGERTLDVLIETQTYPNGDQEQKLCLAKVVDISERKRIETIMRLTQFSIDHAVDSVFWVAPDARILYVNDAACSTLGYTREELMGKTVPEIDPNFPVEAWPAHWEEIRQRKRFSFESDHHTKTGELIHTEVTVNYLVFEGREYNCAMMRNITERKEAEIHLSKLAAIVTSSEDAIMSKTLDGIITSWNESATRLFGYTAAEMIGTPISRLFPPDRLDEETDILRRILTGKSVEHLETVRMKQDGTLVDVSETISPIKNAAGKIIGASKIVRDISERRRAEDALRESEQRFQAFMNQSPVVAWLKDENFVFRYVNNSFEQLFNLSAEQILGRTDYEIYDKEAADATRANDMIVLASDTGLEAIEPVPGADGRMRQWLVHKFPLRRTGHPTWTGGTAVDVTDRREAEEALRDSNERFRLLFEGANDAIFWADADTGLLIQCNHAAETLLGRGRDEIVGQSYSFVHHPEDALLVQEVFEAHSKAKSQASVELDILRKDGRRVAVSISPTVTTIGGKQILQGIFRDITERKQAEQKIREGDRNYSALFEQSAICVSQVDSRSGRFLRVNNYYCELLGYSLAEMLQLDFQTVIHPDDFPAALGNIARLNTGKQRTFQMETRLLRKDSEIVWIRLTVVPLWSENSPVSCHLSFVEDITQRVLAEAERRQAEQALRRSEERFSRLYSASPVSLLVATYPEGKIVEVNDAFLQLFGYERDDVLGKPTTEIKIWADLQDRERMIEHLRRDGSYRNRETVFRTKLGETRTVLFSVELIELDGQTHSLATSIDITERKQTEEALRKTEERYQLVVRGLNDGIWDWNVLTGEAYHSPRWNEILGYDEDELPTNSTSFFESIHPDDRAAVDRAVRRKLEQNERFEIEFRMRCKDGNYRWILSRGETVRDAAGQPIRMVGSITDIGKRKLAEQALRESELRYRTFIDTCSDSVFLLDIEGNILSANPAATRMNGYSLDELLTMNIRDLDDPADAQIAPERLRRLKAGESLRFEVVHFRKDGTLLPLEVHASPVKIGNEVFILAFDRDISERKRSEEQTNLLREELAYTSRLVTLREMASGLAHELNQPLTALSLYIGSAIELAAKYNSTNLNECMRRISEQLQHSGEIIRSMRSFASRGHSQHEYININLMINDVIQLLAGELHKSEAITTLELCVEICPVLTSGIKIKQVLVNLIRNALEAVSVRDICDRKVVIRTELLQNEVRVSVSDSGPGLDPAIAKRLFLPFQTTKPDGLGMGLAICRTLIEALGGRIGVLSSESGASFYFELPRSLEALPT